jgi:hypothetical protein
MPRRRFAATSTATLALLGAAGAAPPLSAQHEPILLPLPPAAKPEPIVVRPPITVGVPAGALLPAPAPGLAPEEAGRLALTTERVVVFKDGYALVVKSAVATADDRGRVFTDQVPDTAVLGSFWATADDLVVRAMWAEWVTDEQVRSVEGRCLTIPEVLRANVGRAVVLDAAMGGPALTIYTGTLEALLETDDPPGGAAGAPAPGGPGPAGGGAGGSAGAGPGGGGAPARGDVVREVTPRGGQYLVLRTDNPAAERLVLPVEDVRAVSGNGLSTTVARRESVTRTRKRLTIELDGAAGRPVRLNLLYFTPGIRWIPTYRVAGAGPGGELADTARVSLQGEILNELEDLDGAAVDLVVGVPSFRFRSLPSPLALEGTLRHALAQAAPALMGVGRGQAQQFANVMFQQRAGDWSGEAGPSPGVAAPGGGLDLAADLSSTAEQDLHVYSVPGLRLPKGSRAAAPIWSSTVPIRHVYTMDVNVVRSPRGGGGSDYYCYDSKSAALAGAPAGPAPPSPLRPAQQPVWHQLEMTNASAVPWTTGPAMLLRGSLPLGQDLLTYTSPGASALLPVTVAMDVRGTYTEEELDRKPNALRWNRADYALIRKRATITVVNNRREPSSTRLTVSLGGRAEEASDGGRITLNDLRADDWGQDGEFLPNNHSDAAWSFDLKAGESRTVTLVFHFYVP